MVYELHFGILSMSLEGYMLLMCFLFVFNVLETGKASLQKRKGKEFFLFAWT